MNEIPMDVQTEALEAFIKELAQTDEPTPDGAIPEGRYVFQFLGATLEQSREGDYTWVRLAWQVVDAKREDLQGFVGSDRAEKFFLGGKAAPFLKKRLRQFGIGPDDEKRFLEILNSAGHVNSTWDVAVKHGESDDAGRVYEKIYLNRRLS